MPSREHRVWGLIAESARGRPATETAAQACRACVEATGVDGAGLWLGDSAERRIVVHATDRTAEELEDLQFVLGEGPCTQAWETGGPILVENLAERDCLRQWPAYAPAALRAGAAAVFAFPLQTGAVQIGTLDLYRAAPGALTPDQLSDALVFAAAALTVVTAHPRALDPEHLMRDDSLDEDTVLLHRAAGMVSVQLDDDIDTAYARLRAHAFVHDLRLREVARRVVDRSLRFEPEDRDG